MDIEKIKESFEPEALRESLTKVRWWASVAACYGLLAVVVVTISLLPKSDFGFTMFAALFMVATPVALVAGTALAAAELTFEPEWLINIMTNPRWLAMVAGGFIVMEILSEGLTQATGGRFWEPVTRRGLLLLVVCVLAGVVVALLNPKPFNLLFNYTSVDPWIKSTWMAGLMFATLLVAGIYMVIFNGTSTAERVQDKQKRALDDARKQRHGYDNPRAETEPVR